MISKSVIYGAANMLMYIIDCFLSELLIMVINRFSLKLLIVIYQ